MSVVGLANSGHAVRSWTTVCQRHECNLCTTQRCERLCLVHVHMQPKQFGRSRKSINYCCVPRHVEMGRAFFLFLLTFSCLFSWVRQRQPASKPSGTQGIPTKKTKPCFLGIFATIRFRVVDNRRFSCLYLQVALESFNTTHTINTLTFGDQPPPGHVSPKHVVASTVLEGHQKTVQDTHAMHQVRG